MTVEIFFSNLESTFSGYEDISEIDHHADCYVWFYLVPYKTDNIAVANEIRSYVDTLNLVISRIAFNKTIFVFTIRDIFKVRTVYSDNVLYESIYFYNSSLYKISAEKTNVKVVDFTNFLDQYSENELLDWKYYFLSNIPLNPKISKSFQAWFAIQLQSTTLKRKKCLILDLDNTLWSGVIGEDGLDGIFIGGDYPGNAFLFFQHQIEELGKQGVILAICSKNNIEDIRLLWARHPFIVLKEQHFSAIKINWNNKADNILALIKELNIGLDSIVFLDDNPTERELVKHFLPDVIVPEFPSKPYMLPMFLKDISERFFSVYSLTNEDLEKTQQYRSNALRNYSKGAYENMDDYIRSLQIELLFTEANDITIPRVAQMSQKTNQFNLTTQRYSESEIKSLINKGAKIYILNVRDKFGDSGITGLCIVKIFNNKAEIDSFLLSCRILGKRIENAFFNCVLKELKLLNINEVTAKYIPTTKNSQVAEFFDQIGLALVNEENDHTKCYKIKLSDISIVLDSNYKYLHKR